MATHDMNGKNTRRRRARRRIDNRHVRTSRRWRNPESQFPEDRFYVKTPEFRDVIARAARTGYEGRHASMVSSWGTTWEYHIFNDIMRVDRMAPGPGLRSGTWFASPETLRFGLYRLKVQQPPLLEGETTVFSFEQLEKRRRMWEIHIGLAPLGEPSGDPGVHRASTLIREGGDPHIPLRVLGGKTAFEAAIERGREDLMLLYAATPRTDFDPGEILPVKSPLHLAVLSGNPEVVEWALATHRGLHEEVHHEGRRIPLFELAGILGHTWIERLLLWETKGDDPERLVIS